MIDAGNHVTCIVSWPSVIKEGRITISIVDFSDMLPTVCQAAGAGLPDDLTIDGQSFLPLLHGREDQVRESIFMWYERNGKPNKAKEFARNQRYKLYKSGAFFDIKNDRGEKKPLAPQSLNEKQKRIKAMLQAKIDSFAAVVPPQAR